MPNAIAVNVLGTIGAVLWSIQIIPQIWKSHRTKSTEGLSAILMFTWAVASIFLGTYVIVQNISIPIIIQPQTFGILATISTLQCMHYNPRFAWSIKKCLIALVAFCALFAGFEVGFYYALKAGEARGITWPTLLMGIISAILLAAALGPQYYEIYKYKEVFGLSLTFMAIDMGGGVFCILSLAFGEEIDILAACNYGAVVLLDGIVMILAVILNPRAARRRKALLTSSAENEKGEPSSASSTTALGQEDHSPIEQGRERIEAAASRSDRMPGESGRELETVEERSREILSPMARHLDV